jgi:hypothetical protein
MTVAAIALVDEDQAARDSRALRQTLGAPFIDGGLTDSTTSPPSEVSDDTTKCCLDSFINEVTRKRDSPLIREPPKQPLAKAVLLWWSRRLAAKPLSRVPTSK